ncbi:MAG: (2Fe-2S)-binding protein [Candidatus Eremiobacteraeota bacterium]|nr:(2Fe-2S)-binding protein [Candidatus Eremiobacteraeota bacterium]
MRFLLDGKPMSFRQGDSVLAALLRNGEHPTSGGCLCYGGDCPSCLATVDGISYVRTCQTPATPGLTVERHPEDGLPPLPSTPPSGVNTPIRHLFCEVAVVFQGDCAEGETAVESARESGRSVQVIDSRKGQEVVGIYAGPVLLARTDKGMIHLQISQELVVATGSAEILPVVPGSHLQGLYTADAALRLSAEGVDLGSVVAVGAPPQGLDCQPTSGELLRFEGEDGNLTAVVTVDREGQETTYPCRSAALNLGRHPRNQLALMASDLPLKVTVLGGAAGDGVLPRCPRQGVVCPCEGVSVEDLEYTWESGFQELELIKRSTLAGTGACQGMGCLPYLRSFIKEKTGELQPRFTARPVVRQLTLGEISAGAQHVPDLRTPLHEEHLALEARMERSGPWWRPWNYGNTEAEYWAVREGVSVMDVSTLGKMVVSGPDALNFLERIYPTNIGTIKVGRSRYVLLLDERGYVFDDGLVAKESDTRYALTFTSGGSSHCEMWLRDWAAGWEMDVRLANLTYSLGAINLTGPFSRKLLQRLGLTEPPGFMHFADQELAGVPCRVYRLSFTGELSYELHHPVQHSVDLWRTLMKEGKDLGIRPHGLEALSLLRLEKGHIIVHQDTDFDSTPKRIQHEWMVKMEKERFLGRQALLRTNALDPDKALVGLEMDGPVPYEGATLRFADNYAGFVTSSGFSPALGKGLMLAHLHTFEGALPEVVEIDGRTARRVSLPFYDEKGERARA